MDYNIVTKNNLKSAIILLERAEKLLSGASFINENNQEYKQFATEIKQIVTKLNKALNE